MIEFNPRNFRFWSIMGINPSIWSVAFPEIIDRETTAILTADVAKLSGMTRIASSYPEIFYNVGIAEQNMMGIGAGMALNDHDVYMTTYATFMTYRCFDQFRQFLGNMNLNIKAIGSAAGLSGGKSGNALCAISDIAVARSIPNVTVLSPADCTEAIKMVLAFKEYKKPTYMRFCGAVNIPCVYKENYNFEIGKGVKLNDGERIALVATGTNLVQNALEVANIINEKYGFTPLVVNIHTIKPLDKTLIEEILDSFETVYTIEEHNIIGGLGSAVAEVKANMSECKCKIIRLGVEDKLYSLGSREYMLREAGLDTQSIACKVRQGLV